ncbi:DUF397 domain-containing protein [Streptomyces sp. NPDC017056]|uniref:DUF397 domain-containing protein n=1 Tax=Streptomyces sp. NPDC017056 TaxID=3364973 RepID=UPI0037A24398
MTTENAQWFTSSYSNNGGQCIEVATNLAASCGVVPVRDSKLPNGPQLTLTPGAWVGLVRFARQTAV